ncbi:MAG: hypothetical protein FD119_447 [Stygiobacter sp.]|nr:MAG: hypothetical protein FD119_447 [Stygiobacter sp.]
MNTHITIIPPGQDMAPMRRPELFNGITLKRIFAYLIDLVVISVLVMAAWVATGLLGILSFGLLLPLQAMAVVLLPLAYHTLLIASPASATLGMRVMGIQVVTAADGLPPSLLQALILTVAFFGSVALTGFLVLIIALFTPQRRTLHDFLAGTVVINAKTRL